MKIIIIAPTNTDLSKKIMGGADNQLLKMYNYLKKHHQTKLYTGKQIKNMGIYNFLEIYKHKIECDLLIVFRKALVLPELKAKYKIFYSQDTIDTPCFNYFRERKGYLDEFDEIICLSKFHRKHLMKETGYNGKIRIIGNSTNIKQVRKYKKPTKDFIYASAPHKGLIPLAMFWKKYNHLFPESTLHIYSSFNLYHLKEEDKKFDNFKKIKALPRVKYHKIVENKRLTDQINACKLMIYPCNYAETYGNVVNESLAVRTPIITSRLGSLPELIKDTEFLIKGDPYSKEYQEELANKIIECQTTPTKFEQYQKNCKSRHDKAYYEDIEKLLQEVKQYV